MKGKNFQYQKPWKTNFLFFDMNKPFNHWRHFLLLIGGSFFLNMIINFIENYFANFTSAIFWWIYQAAKNFVGKTFFVIFYSYIRFCFLHFFSILSEIGNFSVIFLSFLFILYNVERFDFLQFFMLFSLNSFLYPSYFTSYIFLDLSAKTWILLLFLYVLCYF